MCGNPLISPLIQFRFQNEAMVGKEKQEKRKQEVAGNQFVLF